MNPFRRSVVRAVVSERRLDAGSKIRVWPWSCLMLLVGLTWLGCGGGSGPPHHENPLAESIRQVRAGTARSIDVDAEVVDADLELLADLVELEALRLPHATVSDAGVTNLCRLAHLARLDLGAAEITDAGLAALAGLKGLRHLNLANTRLTDAAWGHLSAFPRLELLRLGAAGMGDQSVQALRDLKALRHVHLMDVRLTDQGLRHFEGMQQLESLYLDRVQVTDAGLTSLLKALPHLHIHLGQTHPAGVYHDGDH